MLLYGHGIQTTSLCIVDLFTIAHHYFLPFFFFPKNYQCMVLTCLSSFVILLSIFSFSNNSKHFSFLVFFSPYANSGRCIVFHARIFVVCILMGGHSSGSCSACMPSTQPLLSGSGLVSHPPLSFLDNPPPFHTVQ